MGLKEDLDILDVKINKLKVDYEQYFAKVLKKEPAVLRNEIDRIILKYSNQPTTNTSLKFRYSTLTAKYTSYKQFWNRILRRIEDGNYERGAGFGVISPAAAANREPMQGPGATPASSEGLKKEMPDSDSRFKTVYQQFMDAKKSCQDTSGDMSYEKFTQAIIQQTEKVKKDMKCSDVEYKVVVKDGKTKITLIPISKK
ncbi:MAG: MXAN_5187 C-terminal domain-containing protein [Deltaproteobacteria bacterium]|nr:MXAN_5187 C-terminal domain-containing protein [Deltaproteobacteria bacterium]